MKHLRSGLVSKCTVHPTYINKETSEKGSKPNKREREREGETKTHTHTLQYIWINANNIMEYHIPNDGHTQSMKDG